MQNSRKNEVCHLENHLEQKESKLKPCAFVRSSDLDTAIVWCKMRKQWIFFSTFQKRTLPVMYSLLKFLL